MRARKCLVALGVATLLAGYGSLVAAAQPHPAQDFNLAVMGGPEGPDGAPLISDVMVSFSSADDMTDHYTTILDRTPGRDPRLTNGAPGGRFDFYLAVEGFGDGSVRLPDQPNADGVSTFHQTFLDRTGQSHSLIGLLRFGPTMITPGSWASFNPQPEPPGFVLGVAMTFPADPYASFSLKLDGQQLSFASAPEPAAWALMFAGTALTGAAMRLRRRTAAIAAY